MISHPLEYHCKNAKWMSLPLKRKNWGAGWARQEQKSKAVLQPWIPMELWFNWKIPPDKSKLRTNASKLWDILQTQRTQTSWQQLTFAPVPLLNILAIFLTQNNDSKCLNFARKSEKASHLLGKIFRFCLRSCKADPRHAELRRNSATFTFKIKIVKFLFNSNKFTL